MFRAEEILNRLRQQPFRPLRIIASEGLRSISSTPTSFWSVNGISPLAFRVPTTQRFTIG